jgi:DNA polymerase-3 subunit delta'
MFGEIIGHERLLQLLGSELRRPAQSYLFVGPSGVGKASVARRFAAGLLCPDEWQHHDPCRSCRRVESGNHPDFALIEPDGASLGVDAVRAAVLAANLTPVEGERKVFVFDEASSMTDGAANALLKTLEEPSKSTHFILIADSEEDLPPTIASRCRVLQFGRVGEGVVRAGLVERGVGEDRALEAARIAAGRPGLAILLSSGDRIAEFRTTWIGVPPRVSSDPGDASRLASELVESTSPLLDTLRERHALEEATTKASRDRQQREMRRAGQELLANGLELLASVYTDAAASQFGGAVRNADLPMADLIATTPHHAVRNAEACLDAVIALRRNQRPSLVLTSLVMELADG